MAQQQTLAQQIEKRRRDKQRQAEGSTTLIRGAGGQLQNVTGEEVQTLSSKLGHAAPPTSPLAGAQMGMSPDQTKMLGDARQKKAALDIGLGGESQVSQQARTEQARTQATDEEAGSIQKSATLEAMGGLGDRIHGLMQGAFEGLKAKEQAGLTQAEVDRRLEAGEDTTNVDYGTAASEASDQGVDYKDLRLSDDDVIAMGYAGGLQELSGELGQDVSQMSMQQIQDLVSGELDQSTAAVDQARAVLGDPNASPAMRSEARRLLRDQGAVGTLSAAEQADDIDALVSESGRIVVGGKEYSVEDILSDKGMEDILGEYVSLDPEARSDLAEKNPDFAELYRFAEDHEAAISKAKEETKKNVETSTEQRRVRMEEMTASGLDSDLLESIYPDWDKYGSDVGDVPEILKQAKDSDVLAANLTEINRIDPELMQELAGADIDTLRELGLVGDNSEENQQRWADTKELLEAQDAQNIDEFAQRMELDTDTLEMELSNIFEGDKILSEGKKSDVSKMFDANADGKRDDWLDIRKRIEKAGPKELRSLAETLSSATNSNTIDTGIDTAISAGNVGTLENMLSDKGDILTPSLRSKIEEGISTSIVAGHQDFIDTRISPRLEASLDTSSDNIIKNQRAVASVERDLQKMIDDPRVTDPTAKENLQAEMAKIEEWKSKAQDALGRARMDESAAAVRGIQPGQAAIPPSLLPQ